LYPPYLANASLASRTQAASVSKAAAFRTSPCHALAEGGEASE